MMATKNSWKRSAAWVTALRDKPLKSARFKLTALYILLTFLILGIYITALGYVRSSSLVSNLTGKFANPVEEQLVIRELWNDLHYSALILAVFVLVAISVLSWYSVQLTLRPVKTFLEAHRRFIADASHELRTPLATMRAEIEVALLDPESVTPKEAVEILSSNVEEIDRMSKILTNLLNLASFNDVGGTPQMTPVEMADLLSRCVDRLRNIAVSKRVDLVAKAVEPTTVHGNTTALEEVVLNLIKNAVHYSHAGGKVTISLLRYEDRYAELKVRDEGIGIHPSELPHIFEAFYRSERSLHMYKSGTGLGLSLVKEIVRRHRGSIHVESAPDRGTAVTVRLPLAQPG